MDKESHSGVLLATPIIRDKRFSAQQQASMCSPMHFFHREVVLPHPEESLTARVNTSQCAGLGLGADVDGSASFFPPRKARRSRSR